MMASRDGDDRDAPAVAPAGSDQSEVLAALEQSAFPDPWSAREIATLLDSGAIVGFLARLPVSREPVAYALVQLLPGEGELLRIGVPPGRRRRGYARHLLAQVVERLRTAGRPVVHLEVRAENRAAQALYEQLGFESVGLRRHYYSDGADAIRYRLGPREPEVEGPGIGVLS